MAPPLATSDPRSGDLTRRELQVLREYGTFCSWKAVGKVLGISPRTARHHGDEARRKLGGVPLFAAIRYAERETR